jgi:hypothetical protein
MMCNRILDIRLALAAEGNMSEFRFGDYGYGQIGDAASAAAPAVTEASLNLTDPDINTGYTILKYFYFVASGYPSFKLSSAVDILNFYMQTWPGPFDPNSFLTGLGLGANASGMSSGDQLKAMTNLANLGQGQVPTNPSTFAAYLTNQATQVSSWSAALYAAQQAAQSIVTGLEKVGDTALSVANTTLNTVNLWQYAIYSIPAVILWHFWTNRESYSQAAKGGLLSLGSSASERIKKKISGNPKRRRR